MVTCASRTFYLGCLVQSRSERSCFSIVKDIKILARSALCSLAKSVGSGDVYGSGVRF